MVFRLSAVVAMTLSIIMALSAMMMPISVLAQDSTKVVEVVVTGNTNINTDTISNAISLKPGDTFTEAAVKADRVEIMSLGYFAAVTVRQEQVPGGLKVIYEVTENPKVTDIKIVGSGPIQAEEIQAVMKTKPGQVLNSATLDQDVENIIAYYMDKGYLAYPTEGIGVDPDTGVLTIPILVHVVESVEIVGNKKTKSYVFLREMETKPGDYYNVRVLEEDMQDIWSLNILEDIQEPQREAGSEIGLVRITIPVVEKKTGQISVGFGYSSRQKLVGQARLAETNFRGKGQGLNLLWEQGTSDAVGGPASYEVGFYEPWLDKNNTSLSVSAYNKVLYRFSSTFGGNELPTGYNERHKGGDLTLSRPISDDIRLFVGGRFENVETDPDLLSQIGDLFEIAQSGDVATGSLRAVHDTRNNTIDPVIGGYESFSFEFGSVDAVRFVEDSSSSSGFASVPFEGPFTKSSIDLRRYFSKGGPIKPNQNKRNVIAFRLRAGIANGTIPFFEQFFVGGGESLRGYSEDRFWGNKMLVASLEFRKPIAQAITGVVFADYGDAWDTQESVTINDFEQSQSFQGHLGVGIGMRVQTPIGNLRLDYGIGDEGGRTHFSMGHAF